MRPVAGHPDDDRLLELAYGEAPASEARALRQHVDGCARCRKVLEGIAEVRTAFRSVPPEAAPERGLESLLAYGEQAAARARSRRGGLRILALLSAATALAVAWLVVPASSHRPADLARAPASGPPDTLAQADVPRSVAQGDRVRDEVDRSKDLKQNEKKAPAVSAPLDPLAKAERAQEEQPARRGAPEPAKEKGAKEAAETLESRMAQPKVAEAPAAHPSGHAFAGQASSESATSGTLGIGSSSGGKAGAGTFAAEPMAGMAKKRAPGGRADADTRVTGAPPASGTPPAALAAAPPPAQTPGEDARARQVAKVLAPQVGALVTSGDKAAAAVDAAPAAAGNAAKPAPPMKSMRLEASSPEKQARLAEIKRQLETATGDRRKALLMEQCELHASLQLGPDAVLSCSQVTREFPGTPEAKRAAEIARGFSLQLPAEQER